MYNIGEMRSNGKNAKTLNGEVCRSLLGHSKRTKVYITLWICLFVALTLLFVRASQSQDIKGPVCLQGTPPQIHLELDPAIKIAATIQDSPVITEDSILPLQDTLSFKVTDSSKEDTIITKNKVEPDWSGLMRDSLYFVGYQVVVIGFLYAMPESVSGWSDEQKSSYSFEEWAENIKDIGWDEDDWYLNYIFHPYWGATYYIRARERGLNKFHSFLYSAFLSSVYEFGLEALFENPSIQDLIVTPLLGSLLGTYFDEVREDIKAKGAQLKWYDKLTLILTDPLGTANNFLERQLGIQSSVELKSLSPKPQKHELCERNFLESGKRTGTHTWSENSVGVEVKMVW